MIHLRRQIMDPHTLWGNMNYGLGDRHICRKTDTQTHQYHDSAWPKVGPSENQSCWDLKSSEVTTSAVNIIWTVFK